VIRCYKDDRNFPFSVVLRRAGVGREVHRVPLIKCGSLVPIGIAEKKEKPGGYENTGGKLTCRRRAGSRLRVVTNPRTSASYSCECCYRALRKWRLRQNNSLWRVHRHGRARLHRLYTHALEGSATRRMHARSRYHHGGLGIFPFFAAAFHNRRKRAVIIFPRIFIFHHYYYYLPGKLAFRLRDFSLT